MKRKKSVHLGKRNILVCCLCLMLVFLTLPFCYGQGNPLNRERISSETEKFPYENIVSDNEIDYANPQTDFRNMLKAEIVEPESYKENPQGGYFKGFIEFLSLQRFTATTRDGEPYTEKKSGIAYLTYLINIGIALSVFIALLFIIYGFFNMLFTKDEEGFSKAKKIVTNSAIAIGIIGISWFIITFLFYAYSRVGDINLPDQQQKKVNSTQRSQP